MGFEYKLRLCVLIQICLGEESRISFFYWKIMSGARIILFQWQINEIWLWSIAAIITDKGTLKYSEENLSQCGFVPPNHHFPSHMCWPKIRPGFLMYLLIWGWNRYLLKGNCHRFVQPSFKSHLKCICAFCCVSMQWISLSQNSKMYIV